MCKLIAYKNNKYVADIKIGHIKNISRQAEACKNIIRIMLFGSSVEERCTEKSDIDIAVFGKNSKAVYLESKEFRRFQDGLFKFDMDQDYDILYFVEGKSYADVIMKDINDGVEIFRRGEA
ncbi:MAG: nucleotidyltransferase domain-containing protein [Lachnospiraceae bacterium]|nr:nucleotidyltransferase domain-containing protein [Lachnospiraceae bacterium]